MSASGSSPVPTLPDAPVTRRRVLHLWVPLAASWLLMAVELPLFTTVVARLADPEIHLAAYGSIVFPVSLVIEAPIIMLLAASTALCTHWRPFVQVRKFMLAAGATLTAIHVAVAFTPLYDLVARDVMGAPPEVLEAGRLGLRIMTPWTWAIAYRRFYQGVLIRHEASRAVVVGTFVRLLANASVLTVGALLGGVGIVVGASAVATGVTAEAVYVGRIVRPVLARLRDAPPRGPPLTTGSFRRFYVPLAMTPLITLLIQPLGAAAMNRMPQALLSVAAWQAVHGVVFLMRSVGMAYNEVVVTLVGQPGGPDRLRRFHRVLALATSGVLALLAVPPVARVLFEDVLGLHAELAGLARQGLLLAVPMAAYAVLQSWFQGVLVHDHRTRPITEAVVLYFVVSAALLVLGVSGRATAGLTWAVGSFVVAGVLQTTWLWLRSRQALARLAARAGPI